MRAAVLRKGSMVVDEYPQPVPEKGQVLVQVKACGICGSDLHFAQHPQEIMAMRDQMRGAPPVGETCDLDADIFMGHEFSAEILEAGPDTEALPPGTIVTSLPGLKTKTGVHGILHSNTIHGGYGEQMLLTARLLLEVPNGLDPAYAALTEPMAVGLHAVNKSSIQQGEGALVLGAGPVGQAIIASLALKGIEPIIAADFSPARRDLALRMGAHEAVDPHVESAYDAWDRLGGSRPLVLFEAIGVPGILGEVMRMVPANTRVVVAGVCNEPDTTTPYFGVAKELNIQFVLAYNLDEFAHALRAIAEGDIDVSPLVTGRVPLDGVGQAFADLADPERHCKIVVTP